MGCDVRKRKPKSHSLATRTQETSIQACRVGLVVDLKKKRATPTKAPLFFCHLIPIFVFISVYLSYSGTSRESSLGHRAGIKLSLVPLILTAGDVNCSA